VPAPKRGTLLVVNVGNEVARKRVEANARAPHDTLRLQLIANACAYRRKYVCHVAMGPIGGLEIFDY